LLAAGSGGAVVDRLAQASNAKSNVERIIAAKYRCIFSQLQHPASDYFSAVYFESIWLTSLRGIENFNLTSFSCEVTSM